MAVSKKQMSEKKEASRLMGWLEGEVGYVWLEISIDGKDCLVGGYSYAPESEFKAPIVEARTDEDLSAALTKIINECLSAEGDLPPFVNAGDDGSWVVDFDAGENEPVKLGLDDVKRAFFEYICCEEVWCDSYNFKTGLRHADEDMSEHPQEKFHGMTSDGSWITHRQTKRFGFNH